MSDEAIITIENVSFSYGNGLVLEDVNLTIGRRELVWIVGPNGGGKTTLLKLIIGLLQPDRGKVRVLGKTPTQSRSKIGYMPQVVSLDSRFPVSVMDIVLMGRLGNGRMVGPFSRSDKVAAEQALESVGLVDLRDRHFSSLSGGEQRRLFIARALACNPEVLMLDEPLANLDVIHEKEINDMLRRLSEQLTVILVSHDPAVVSHLVENVVCVNRRVHIHPTYELDGEMMGELYEGKVRIVRHDQRANGEHRHD